MLDKATNAVDVLFPLQAPACKGALLCLGQVLAAVEPGAWHAAVPGFQLLLSFLTDARPKVRKRAQSSLTDILAALQNTHGTLASASEAVVACEFRGHTSQKPGSKVLQMVAGCGVFSAILSEAVPVWPEKRCLYGRCQQSAAPCECCTIIRTPCK
eukprot:GHUV01042780.1.p1 GENE.GHUV01042780.1~~GHUV01042780.1.p1  ORF type:complete len:156 (-),score=30.70 GHUV01042780.1:212-679(-)